MQFVLPLFLCFSALAAEEIHPATYAALIAELADDTVRWNATLAWDQLRHAGPEAREELELGLRSPDHQQRMLCAAVMWQRFPDNASAQLLEVSVEALAADDIPWDGTHYLPLANATRSMRFLHGYVSAGPSAELLLLLENALLTGDAQQQFCAAFLLGCAGSSEHAERIVEILAPHLGTNAIDGDASTAAHALLRTGTAAIPALERARTRADPQAVILIDYLLAGIAGERARSVGALKLIRNPHARTPLIMVPNR